MFAGGDRRADLLIPCHGDPMADIDIRLREISAKGDPAHREQALLLIETLHEDPQDAQAHRAAELLVDAYLHDPYLTRS